MKTTFKTLLATACISMAATSIAVAESGEKDGPSNHCAKGHHKARLHAGAQAFGQPYLLHGITLTSEQEDKVFALHHAEIPKVREHMKQRQQLNQALQQVSQTTPFDEAKANVIASKLATLEKESALNRARAESQVLGVLTPEQREQALKNKALFDKPLGDHKPAGFHRRPQQRPDVRG